MIASRILVFPSSWRSHLLASTFSSSGKRQPSTSTNPLYKFPTELTIFFETFTARYEIDTFVLVRDGVTPLRWVDFERALHIVCDGVLAGLHFGGT